jgi:hypothetical protein
MKKGCGRGITGTLEAYSPAVAGISDHLVLRLEGNPDTTLSRAFFLCSTEINGSGKNAEKVFRMMICSGSWN